MDKIRLLSKTFQKKISCKQSKFKSKKKKLDEIFLKKKKLKADLNA